jgi:3-deoxy-7-phosphoheptulonate synthase
MLTTRPLTPPVAVLDALPLSAGAAAVVTRARQEVVDILDGDDDRLVVVVGPCSIHDPAAAVEYARRLAVLADELERELRIVMRVYCEKPRTTVGWKGLIHDPHLDGSGAVNDGLLVARELLLKILALGLPAGCEFLDPLTAPFFADAITWGSIGARTCESPVHRQLASDLPMPVGFKNGTHGGLQAALDGIRTAAYPHHFLSIDAHGHAAIVTSSGNRDCHVILRGGPTSNYDAGSVRAALHALQAVALPRRVMIDASHGNSGKDHRHQPGVVRDVALQVATGQNGISGVMLESFLVEGRQDLADPAGLTFGQSITDACLGWEATVPLLHDLAAAVRARRKLADLRHRRRLTVPCSPGTHGP